ncbi:MAG TPA: cytochrome c oxidase assembly protein [Gammaproteobacteria bacterium]|nr:cytochrome c oxidase assembly protein [Gammaproteobacteria bacterium]
MSTESNRPPARRRNWAVLVTLSCVTVGMFGFGYLLVPFYDVFCKLTGLRDIDAADRVEVRVIDASRSVRIELDANVNDLPWVVRPATPVLSVHPGELTNVSYEVENTTDRPMTGQAVASYGPALAAQYFKKLECFCFTKQDLAAHEKRLMPVVFTVDPKLPKDVDTITLSYTFFEVEGSGS